MQDYCKQVTESKKLGNETGLRSAVPSSLQLLRSCDLSLTEVTVQSARLSWFLSFFRQNLETKCAISL